MNIFVIPTSYPNEKNPVADIFIYEQVKALSKLGHHVIVLHVSKLPTREIFKPLSKVVHKIHEEHCTRYTIEIKTFAEGHFPEINYNNFCLAMMLLYEYAVKDGERPDVLYSHFSLYAGIAAARIKEKYKIPLMTLEHSSYLMSRSIKKFEAKCLEDVVKISDCFATVSDGLKQAIEKHIGVKSKILIIPNMIDDCFTFYPSKKNDVFTFLAIGNLNARKRFELLINSFCDAFNQDDSSVQLIIGGTGELYEKLNDMIYGAKRSKQIHLLGKISREKSLQEYINCDCFVLPSSSETFGLVYREAMAVGRPIITTDHGGFSKDTWSDSWGKIIPVDDSDSLTASMQYMRKHINEYDNLKISKDCLLMHSSTVIGEVIESKLEEVFRK